MLRKRKKYILSYKWSVINNLQNIDKIFFKTWNRVLESFSHFKNYTFKLLTIFGSTYYSKQVFSNMNLIKIKLRSNLTGLKVECCFKLKITEYLPNIEDLSKYRLI